MTLIVGIKCLDGIVMGADGAATFATVTGSHTVLQPVTKLRILQSKVLMGVSGQVGLSQLFCDGVKGAWDNKEFGQNVGLEDVQRKLHQIVVNETKTGLAGSQPFGGNATQLVMTSSLVALPVGGYSGYSELIRIDCPGVAEAASHELPYAAIGSGQPLADPFLAFLRRIFWPYTLPTVAQGIFATMWTLRHAIEVAPGGVADPIQMAVVSKGKGQQFTAKQLSDGEIAEHQQSVEDAEEYLRQLNEKGSGDISPLPEVPEGN